MEDKGKHLLRVRLGDQMFLTLLQMDPRYVTRAISLLGRAHIGHQPGGNVLRLDVEDIETMRGLRPYLLIDESVMREILRTLKDSPGDALPREELCRRVDEAVSGGVDLGELEEALEGLRAAQQIETEGSNVFFRLRDVPAS